MTVQDWVGIGGLIIGGIGLVSIKRKVNTIEVNTNNRLSEALKEIKRLAALLESEEPGKSVEK